MKNEGAPTSKVGSGPGMNLHQRKVDAATPRPDGQSVTTDALQSKADQQPVRRRARAATLLAKALLPVLVIAVGAGAYTYLKATRPEPKKRPAAERTFSVKSQIATLETIQPKLTIYGSTVSGRRVDIRALVSGRVIETSPSLREGGTVQKGDHLLRIDPFGYESAVKEAEALLSEAKARVLEFEASIASDTVSLKHTNEQLALARIDLERAQPLARRGTVSKRTVDERQQTLLQRRQSADQLSNSIKVWSAKIEQQKAIIARLQSSLALAQRRLEETALVAPFNAFVVEVTSQVGRMVGANDKIATLIDRDWIEARFTLSDEQFGRIISGAQALEGREVEVIWSLGDKKISYPAVIERVGAQVNANTGGVEVFARITNPSTPIALRSGAFVEVLVPDKTFSDVVRLAPTALYLGDTVYVIKDGRLAARKIKVVGGDGNDILVSGNIKPGDRVLATRVSTPGDGVRVQEVE